MRQVVTSLGSALLALLCFEGLLRYTPGLLPRDVRAVSYAPVLASAVAADPDFGWSPRPGFTREISGFGHRWRLRHAVLPGGKAGYRGASLARAPIVVLGDSYVYCGEVDEEDSWPFLLGRRTGVPVANFGVRGYGTTQERLFYERYGRALRPKLLLHLLVSNDASDNAAFARRRSAQAAPLWASWGRHSVLFGTLYQWARMRLGRPEGSAESGWTLLDQDIAALLKTTQMDGTRYGVLLLDVGKGRDRAFLKRAEALLDARKVPHRRLSGSLGRFDGHWDENGQKQVAAATYGFMIRSGRWTRPPRS